MKVWFSPRARRRARAVAAWWRENRPDTPDLFRDELEAAEQNLAVLPPTPGFAYETVRGKVIRLSSTGGLGVAGTAVGGLLALAG